MRIGIDFDNTLVSYDEVFWRIAREQSLIAEDVPQCKEAVRDALRQAGREDEWTELQGAVYGVRLLEAAEFSGASEFFGEARRRGWPVCIISHKTQFPYAGPKYDLHAAARNWLRSNGFVTDADSDETGGQLREPEVFFELEKRHKMERIAAEGCQVFIDDLPELLADPAFPPHVDRVLFDPHRRNLGFSAGTRVDSWTDVLALLSQWMPTS